MKKRWLQLLSMVSLGSRHQFTIAMALVTVIPVLVLYYVGRDQVSLSSPVSIAVALACAALMITGYSLLAKYPTTIVKLRSYLESMVRGQVPDTVKLIRWQDDVTAIETSLNMIVERLSLQVRTMRDELRRIEWLLTKSVGAGSLQQMRGRRSDMLRDRGTQTLPDSLRALVGEEVLEDIIGDSLDLIEHCAAVTERDGQCALVVLASGWCRALYRPASHPAPSACDGCRSSSTIRQALALGAPVDGACAAGIRLYAVPVIVNGSVLGAISFGYGDPPDNPATTAALARDAGIDPATLHTQATLYETRPPFIIAIAKNRLLTSARLIAEIIERKRTERSLRENEDELRRHRAHLEDLVRERTTELRDANDRLKQEVAERERAEQLKDEFVSTVSHELRTPLSIAKEGISLLADRIPGPLTEKQERVLTVAKSNVDRLTRIINDLLDISKIEAGRIDLLKRAVDFVSLTRQTVLSFETRAKLKGLELRTVCPAPSLEIFADADRVVQVLTNLLSNAIKFTAEGAVTITILDADAHVECVVADTGAGIAAADLPRLFRKFAQFHRVEGAGEKGTGLGLAIVKSIVELHGGRIWVASTPGEGTRFTFTLPKQPSDNPFIEAIQRGVLLGGRAAQPFSLILVRIVPGATEPPGGIAAFRSTVADQLKPRYIIRDQDEVLAREPDELLILAPVDKRIVPKMLARIRRQLPELAASLAPEAPPTFRYGCRTFPEDGDDAEALLTGLYDDMVSTVSRTEGAERAL